MNKPLARGDFRFFHRLRVRWSEVDLQKIVFNPHYLSYIDVAMADYWRALALPYVESMVTLGGDLFVRRASVEYEASAGYDDVLDMGLACRHVGNSSVQFEGGIFKGAQPITRAELVYVFADPATKQSKRVPDALRHLMLGHAAGQPVLALELGDWAHLGPEASALRAEVFIQEQRVPAEMEWDEEDADAVHAVARNALGVTVATGRLLRPQPHEEGPGSVSRIGRMAVKQALRGAGHGAVVLKALMERARARGDREVRLHAQCDARSFYEREGFVASGPVFEEAGIAHIEMHRVLA